MNDLMMRQHENIGVTCDFSAAEKDHVITILRVVERLHLLSDPEQIDGVEKYRHVIETIHQNHLHISACIEKVLERKPGL